MQTNVMKKISNKLYTWQTFIRIKDEINKSKFVQSLLVMGVMGWIPSAWFYLTPVLAVYGVIKRKELVEYLDHVSKLWNDFFNGSKEEQLEASKNNGNRSFLFRHIGQWLGGKISSSPLTVAKFSFAFYVFLISSMPWSILMIYALYRPKTKILEAMYYQLEATTSALQGFFQKLTNVQKVFFTLFGVSVASSIIGSIFVSSGLIGIFDAGMTMTMLGLTVAGFRLAMTDLAQTLSHPLQLLTHRMGIFLGIIGGNRFAHNLFFGKINGSLGYTYGTIESSGFFPSIYRMLFSTNPYSHNSFYFANSLYNRIATGAGGLLGNLFFSHTANTYGSFHGTLGPSSYQLFFFMIVGAGIGYFINEAVDKVSTQFFVDAGEAWENKPDSPSHSKFIQRIKSVLDFGNNYRYPIISTLTATYLMQSLRMPMYISVLHTCSSPMLTLIFIEGGLLLPALLATQGYRMLKARFFPKKPVLSELELKKDPSVLEASLQNNLDKEGKSPLRKKPEEALIEVLNQKLAEDNSLKSENAESSIDESSAHEASDKEKELQAERLEPVLFAALQQSVGLDVDKNAKLEVEKVASIDSDASSSQSENNHNPEEDVEVVRGRSVSRSRSASPAASRASSRDSSRSDSHSRSSSPH